MEHITVVCPRLNTRRRHHGPVEHGAELRASAQRTIEAINAAIGRPPRGCHYCQHPELYVPLPEGCPCGGAPVNGTQVRSADEPRSPREYGPIEHFAHPGARILEIRR